jgi:hypothetical protein
MEIGIVLVAVLCIVLSFKDKIFKENSMKKLYLPPIIIFLIGVIATIIGSLLKIIHWPYASVTLTVGMLTQVIGIAVLIFVLIKNSTK